MVNRIRDAFELLRRTPAGKQALEEHEREIATDREVHVAAIEESQTELVNALPKLNDAIAKTEVQLERVRKALETAEAVHTAALLARGNAVHRAGHVRLTHQDELAKGADPRIAGVVAKLRAQYMREAVGRLITEYEETGKFSALPSRTPNPLVRVSNNSKARSRRMSAMLDAIKTIDDLHFHAKADVGSEMQIILEGLPDGTVLEVACEAFAGEIHQGQEAIDLYLPLNVAEDFSEVLQPVEFASRGDDGGSGGTGYGADFPEGMPSGIPMAR